MFYIKDIHIEQSVNTITFSSQNITKKKQNSHNFQPCQTAFPSNIYFMFAFQEKWKIYFHV